MGRNLHELDEDEKMKRIRIIDPKLYDEILDMEAKIYSELNDKMLDIAEVKNMVLNYNPKQARRMFENLLKEKKPGN